MRASLLTNPLIFIKCPYLKLRGYVQSLHSGSRIVENQLLTEDVLMVQRMILNETAWFGAGALRHLHEEV
ncbi:hypothetical protein ACJ2_24330 [Pantoea sp. QMID2]|nr:hypothetical protein ACJ3_27920 [Pantoea sp. QMID3]GME42570.1 hypothetical protein ACJ1_30790 [Pantoea sp. QMID1]GME57682.1 hypothetical protein ACJ4_27290 [Pantoea sp. QMID4]GME58038.1 hypothetical protein ACJ2_24330 [Pantoea sp. QMID2]